MPTTSSDTSCQPCLLSSANSSHLTTAMPLTSLQRLCFTAKRYHVQCAGTTAACCRNSAQQVVCVTDDGFGPVIPNMNCPPVHLRFWRDRAKVRSVASQASAKWWWIGWLYACGAERSLCVVRRACWAVSWAALGAAVGRGTPASIAPASGMAWVAWTLVQSERALNGWDVNFQSPRAAFTAHCT